MTREDLKELEATIMKEVVERRNLGDYNADARSIRMLAENQLKLIQHILEKAPRSKEPAK